MEHSALTSSEIVNLIDRYYPAASTLRDIYMRHCESVARKALDVANGYGSCLPPSEIWDAAMIHDIGIVACHAPSIECYGQSPYICHGLEGAKILRNEGMGEKWARIALRHTGAGITRDEVIRQKLPLPVDDYLPETELEQLICYADKFYSKSGDMTEKSLESICRQMERFGPDSMERFMALHRRFSQPMHT